MTITAQNLFTLLPADFGVVMPGRMSKAGLRGVNPVCSQTYTSATTFFMMLSLKQDHKFSFLWY